MAKRVARTEWTKEDRQQAAIEYEVLGSFTKTSKSLGIPKQTIHNWSKEEWWVELTGQVRTEKTAQHRAQYSLIVDLAQDRIIEDLPNATAQQASVIGGIAFDKLRLIDNQPTSISANQDNKALADVCKELSRTMRDHGVVSTQHQVNKPDE